MAPSPMMTRCKQEENRHPLSDAFNSARFAVCAVVAGAAAVILVTTATVGALNKQSARLQDLARAQAAAAQNVMSTGEYSTVHTNGGCAYGKLRGLNRAGDMVIEFGECDKKTGKPTIFTRVDVFKTGSLTPQPH